MDSRKDISACADSIIEHATSLVALPGEADRRHIQMILDNARKILQASMSDTGTGEPKVQAQPAREPKMASKVSEYAVLHLKNGSEALAEYRDTLYPYRSSPKVYQATVATLASSAPISFRELWQGVAKRIGQKDLPDYGVRVVTRLLEARNLIHSRQAKFHLVVPNFGDAAAALWKSLDRRRR